MWQREHQRIVSILSAAESLEKTGRVNVLDLQSRRQTMSQRNHVKDVSITVLTMRIFGRKVPDEKGAMVCKM